MMGGGFKFSLAVLVVAYSWSLAFGCTYRDACTPEKTIRSSKGGYFQDTCPSIFRVNHDCSLTRIGPGFCTYVDACDSEKIIEERHGSIFQDSCAGKFKVERLCELKFAGPGDCEAIDECSGEVIKGKRGETFTDSCPNVHKFVLGCEVTFVRQGTCEFIDPCSDETISAKVGDSITDSCGDTFTIEEQCEKVLRPSGNLVVTVKKAANLPGRDGLFFGRSDPFVKVTGLDVDGLSKVLRTSTKNGDHNPEWEESLSFGTRAWSKITVEIFDEDRGGTDDRLLPLATQDVGAPVAAEADPKSVRICAATTCSSFLLLEFRFSN